MAKNKQKQSSIQPNTYLQCRVTEEKCPSSSNAIASFLSLFLSNEKCCRIILCV